MSNDAKFTDLSKCPKKGRIICLDPGKKKFGVAVTDESRLIITPLKAIERSSWKKLLEKIRKLVLDYDAAAVVIGLPLHFDGQESEMSEYAKDIAKKLSLSLDLPIFLQDERATSFEARYRLKASGINYNNAEVDSVAAMVILEDFLAMIKP
jgi:putative Holliday junction resolvase